MALAALVLVLSQTMRVEAVSSANEYSGLQADAVQHGAIQYVLAHCDESRGKVPTAAEMPCEAVPVGKGAFWILRPNYDNDKAYAFGLVGESDKLHLNRAGPNQLLALPGMTEELVACLRDWRDPDENTLPGGAESDYYLRLPNPYTAKDGPLETIEELLLIKGFTPEIVFGEDLNRNGLLDPNEDDGSVSEPADNSDGKLDRGLAPFVTVYTAEPNQDADGKARVNVNSGGGALNTLLGKVLSGSHLTEVQLRIGRNRPFANVLDFYTKSTLSIDEFKQIADHITTANGPTVRGLVNVNTAPKEVLACLPGLEESDVLALIGARTANSADLDTLAWVAQALPPAKARAIGGVITTRAFQYSADIVSVSADGRAFRRCRIVVDSRKTPSTVVYRQDLTHLGWPLSPDIQDALRKGTSVDKLPLSGGLFGKESAK